MKKSILVAVLISMLLGCAIQNIKTDSSMFSGYTYDEVWVACLKAASDVGFRVLSAEKDGGFIMTVKEANLVSQNENPQMNVILEHSNGTVYVNVQYTEPGQLVNIMGTAKKDISNFLAAVKQRLE